MAFDVTTQITPVNLKIDVYGQKCTVQEGKTNP